MGKNYNEYLNYFFSYNCSILTHLQIVICVYGYIKKIKQMVIYTLK